MSWITLSIELKSNFYLLYVNPNMSPSWMNNRTRAARSLGSFGFPSARNDSRRKVRWDGKERRFLIRKTFVDPGLKLLVLAWSIYSLGAFKVNLLPVVGLILHETNKNIIGFFQPFTQWHSTPRGYSESGGVRVHKLRWFGNKHGYYTYLAPTKSRAHD